MKELKFINIDSKKDIPKATTHRRGLLSFNKIAEKYMSIHIQTSFMIAHTEDDLDSIYLLKVEHGASNSVSVKKTSGYFTIKIPGVLDLLKFRYQENKYMFSIKEVMIDNKFYFKLSLISNTSFEKGTKKTKAA